MNSRFSWLIAGLALLAATTTACGQAAYPTRPIRVIVPYPAGGIVDIVARVITDTIGKNFKQAMVVEAKPGGNSNIGTAEVARSAPERTPARIRIPSYAVWESAVFLLNILAFIFIGLQIRPIIDRIEPGLRGRYFFVAGAGPMPMTRGGTPATAAATTRARGVRPKRLTAASDAKSSAHAQSFTPDALPAVTLPGLRNGVPNFASASRVVSARGCSSLST